MWISKGTDVTAEEPWNQQSWCPSRSILVPDAILAVARRGALMIVKVEFRDDEASEDGRRLAGATYQVGGIS